MSYSEWRSVKLSDISFITMGQSPKSEFYNSHGDGVPFMQGRTTFGYKYHGIDTWCTKPTRMADKNSILMSVRAPVGDVNIATQDLCIGRGLAALNMKNGNNEFLYYLLLHEKQNLISRETGTVFGSINKAGLENLEITIPDDNEQRAIANILSSLDEKIELNNQMNETLEEMAQALFKRWFVDFEFPNAEGQPYKSSGGEMVESELGMIPKGWEFKKLEDICLFNKFSLNKKDKILNISYLDTSNITQNKIDSIQKLVVGQDKIPSRAKRKIRNNSIVYSTVRPNQLHYGILKNPNSNLIVSTGFVVIDETENYHCNDLIYYYLTQTIITEKLQAIGETSTSTYPSIKASDIQSLQILLPKDMDLLNKLCDTLGSINDKINQNNEEGKVIQELRDILLPKLMSGEIRVSDLC